MPSEFYVRVGNYDFQSIPHAYKQEKPMSRKQVLEFLLTKRNHKVTVSRDQYGAKNNHRWSLFWHNFMKSIDNDFIDDMLDIDWTINGAASVWIRDMGAALEELAK